MVHARRRQRLSNEPRDLVRIRRELKLHRDAALKRDIHGSEHHAHAATAQLAKAYPKARITRGKVEDLCPCLIAEWKNDQSAHGAAKATCSCDGVRIVRSPATQVVVPKRAARPPLRSVRGQALGLEDLRGSVVVERLRRDIERRANRQRSALALAEEAKVAMARSRTGSGHVGKQIGMRASWIWRLKRNRDDKSWSSNSILKWSG